jgi:hypothetical protein
MAEFEVNSIDEAKDKIKELNQTEELKKPTPEEIKEAFETFSKAVADFNTKQFEIGTSENAVKFAGYLLEFIKHKIFWTKTGWMGVIKLQEEILDANAKMVITNPHKPFTLGYQALEFTFYALSNVGGIGIQTALDMEKEAKEYGEIIDLVGKQLENARAELKEVQFLQEKWAAYEQGFYYEREPAEEDLVEVIPPEPTQQKEG